MTTDHRDSTLRDVRDWRMRRSRGRSRLSGRRRASSRLTYRTSRCRSRRASRISCRNDARGKGAADEGRRAGDSAARRSRIQLVERSAARRRALRSRDGISAGDRARRDVGRQPHVPHGDRHLRRSARQVSRVSSATTATSGIRGSRSGRRTSTSFAIRGGGAARRRTAKIRFSPARSACSSFAGCRATIPKYFKTVATVKHFAVHSGPEPERHTFDAVVSERDLRESYLPHFEMGIREGGAYSLMCAYNRIDGKPACGSDMLLKDILRGEWKFPGLHRLRLRRDRRHLSAPQGRRHRARGRRARREDRHGSRLRPRVSRISSRR